MGRALSGRPAESRWSRFWLTCQVYWDGFCSDPLGFLQGVLWLSRGLKLRSRHRLSSLIGKSPKAYQLWLQRRVAPPTQPTIVSDRIVALVVVDCRASAEGLGDTLASIDQLGWLPILLASRHANLGAPVIVEYTGLRDLLAKTGKTWVCPIKSGDVLAPAAAAAYAAAAKTHGAILYADDDVLDASGSRRDPHFKPTWNAELFRHHDFLVGACLLSLEPNLLDSLPPQFGWPHEVINRLLERGEIPRHIPEVLHHRRSRPLPTVPKEPLKFASRRPSVSVIIPTRDRADLLGTCLLGLDRTPYAPLEMMIVDNGSLEPEARSLIRRYEEKGARVLRQPGPFNFSALNNQAARLATGELLCFLNNDIEVLGTEWLETMAVQAMRPEVGAVGARLLYPDGSIQHAGIVLGLGGGAGHAHRFERVRSSGYFERANLPQFVSAVTAACLIVERTKFEAIGGFDETSFRVAFNDVDLCLRLNERGWRSFYEPRATLIHHESKSRGKDSDVSNRERFAGELASLKKRWATDTCQDPFHHPSLSRYSEQFVPEVSRTR
jgi:GT2 family glycosyltransferase